MDAQSHPSAYYRQHQKNKTLIEGMSTPATLDTPSASSSDRGWTAAFRKYAQVLDCRSCRSPLKPHSPLSYGEQHGDEWNGLPRFSRTTHFVSSTENITQLHTRSRRHCTCMSPR